MADPNLIYSNGGLGIDLDADGVTTDQMPVLTSASVSGLTTRVQGSLTAAANAQYILEFFGNVTPDPSGHGEGESFLGTATVTTNASGYVAFDLTFDAVYGQYVTATATGTAADGWTSEFSANVAVTGGGTGNAVVGNRVWNDIDGDGVQDSGEAGLSGVTVKLWTAAGLLHATTTSASDGSYAFTNVAPGDYYLEFVLPSGYAFSPSYQTDSTLDSNADPADGRTETFTLIAGQVDPTFDAGLFLPASVGDFVWRDDDGDGVQDAGEPGLADVAVTLHRAADGSIAGSTSTNALGGYSFASVAPGSYYLRFVAPAGHSFSPRDQGTSDALDSDADPAGRTPDFALLAGENKTSLDAGLVPPAGGNFGIIRGRSWSDTDGDGIQDLVEPGTFLFVELRHEDGTYAGSAQYGSDGSYEFWGISPGRYYVVFSYPEVTFSPKDQGPDDVDSDVYGDGRTDVFDLAAGQTVGHVDAGVLVPVPPPPDPPGGLAPQGSSPVGPVDEFFALVGSEGLLVEQAAPADPPAAARPAATASWRSASPAPAEPVGADGDAGGDDVAAGAFTGENEADDPGADAADALAVALPERPFASELFLSEKMGF